MKLVCIEKRVRKEDYCDLWITSQGSYWINPYSGDWQSCALLAATYQKLGFELEDNSYTPLGMKMPVLSIGESQESSLDNSTEYGRID